MRYELEMPSGSIRLCVLFDTILVGDLFALMRTLTSWILLSDDFQVISFNNIVLFIIV